MFTGKLGGSSQHYTLTPPQIKFSLFSLLYNLNKFFGILTTNFNSNPYSERFYTDPDLKNCKLFIEFFMDNGYDDYIKDPSKFRELDVL